MVEDHYVTILTPPLVGFTFHLSPYIPSQTPNPTMYARQPTRAAQAHRVDPLAAAPHLHTILLLCVQALLRRVQHSGRSKPSSDAGDHTRGGGFGRDPGSDSSASRYQH